MHGAGGKPMRKETTMRIWKKAGSKQVSSSDVHFPSPKRKDSKVMYMPFKHTANGRSSKLYVLNKSQKRKKINQHWNSRLMQDQRFP